MKASELEFRLRVLLHTIIFGLGFWAPWNGWLHLDPPGPNAHVWGILAGNLTSVGIGNIGTAFNILLVLGILCTVIAAFLRTWGAAYLGADVVQDGAMHASADLGGLSPGLVHDGPFRHLRNPLYLGTFIHTLALALLMPRSGAIFAIVMIGVLQIRLIFGEEAFLRAALGEPYTAYCSRVRRLWPAVRPQVQASGATPRWPQAFLAEIYMWGVAASFTFAGWRYNASTLIQCVIVFFGLSLVLRALIPNHRTT